MNDKKILLKKLKKKKPRFLNLARYWHLGSVKSWRKPRGIDNKQRLKLKSRPKHPTIGYKNPKEIRGLHPSGRIPVVVNNVKELEEYIQQYGVENIIVYIGGRVGRRKREDIKSVAEALNVMLANG